ncbi:hypothetical protein CPB83DRAFT_846162 [Crepidotus variabilis]|uniref:Uncharacterized protein n=1 Tax=Crepidotus variabilis TaxID=179855 RepID=A0A9P6JUS4_9AGAR|nr:hypothetical protein CPB83DRAFT_846162 [Crepidotus variabilis]
MFKVFQVLCLALSVFSATSLASPNPLTIDGREPLSAASSRLARSPVVQPVPVAGELSNAVRLARGLPPRSPKFRRYLPGRRSPTIVARGPSPSNNPTGTVIQVTRADNGALVGYVPNHYVNSATNRYGVTSDMSSALKVSYNGGELTETNAPDAAHPFLGAVVGPASNSNDLSTGSPDYALLTGSSHTAAGSPPASVGNSYSGQNSESTIWNYNSASHGLTAAWINTDGTTAPTHLYYLGGSDALLLVGDVNAFNSAFPGGYPVVLSLI